MAHMNKYYIYTDSGSETVEAETLAEALHTWGEAPKSIDATCNCDEAPICDHCGKEIQ